MDNGNLYDRMNDAEFKQVSCWTCAHKNPKSNTCKAFPNGIPKAIANGSVTHEEPYPGDNGITYEPKGGKRVLFP